MYIVVHVMKELNPDGSLFEHSDWSTHETLEDAQKEYQNLLDCPSIYTASICGVIESTDYSPIQNLKIENI